MTLAQTPLPGWAALAMLFGDVGAMSVPCQPLVHEHCDTQLQPLFWLSQTSSLLPASSLPPFSASLLPQMQMHLLR